MILRVVVALVVCLCLAGTGCRRKNKGKIEVPKEVDISAESMRGLGLDDDVGAKKGKKPVETSVDIPRGFPEDVPIYQGSKVTQVSRVEGQYAVNFQCLDPVSKVTAYYRDELVSKGWKMETPIEKGTQSLLNGQKQGRLLNMAITAAEKGSQVELSVGIGES